MPVNIGSTSGYMCLDSWVMAKIIQLGVWDFCDIFYDFRNDPKGRQFDQTTQARKGVNIGNQFWSCSNYHTTGCKFTLPYNK